MRGKAYRRRMQQKKYNRLRTIITGNRCIPNAGYMRYGFVDGVWKPVSAYILYSKNSNVQKYLKKRSRRKIRRSKQLFQGNSYRKQMEYHWELY